MCLNFFIFEAPTIPTYNPTYEPSYEPTREPTREPTYQPTHEPTHEPTFEPTYGNDKTFSNFSFNTYTVDCKVSCFLNFDFVFFSYWCLLFFESPLMNQLMNQQLNQLMSQLMNLPMSQHTVTKILSFDESKHTKLMLSVILYLLQCINKNPHPWIFWPQNRTLPPGTKSNP